MAFRAVGDDSCFKQALAQACAVCSRKSQRIRSVDTQKPPVGQELTAESSRLEAFSDTSARLQPSRQYPVNDRGLSRRRSLPPRATLPSDTPAPASNAGDYPQGGSCRVPKKTNLVFSGALFFLPFVSRHRTNS